MEKGGIRVLLVDDEVNLVEAMERLLSLEGYQVSTAGSGREAIDLCRSAPVDIVFLDVNMPDLNGLETYRRLKEIIPDTPVIMITGYGRSLREMIQEARALGVRACIDKPFKINQIIESINEHVPRGA